LRKAAAEMRIVQLKFIAQHVEQGRVRIVNVNGAEFTINVERYSFCHADALVLMIGV
jgi:hypothetical protein